MEDDFNGDILTGPDPPGIFKIGVSIKVIGDRVYRGQELRTFDALDFECSYLQSIGKNSDDIGGLANRIRLDDVRTESIVMIFA